MSDLETLKAQHPGLCFNCGYYCAGNCIENPGIVALIQYHEAELAKAQETIADLENLRDYCKVCPNCGAESDKGPYAPMDEDGCCLSCGADCSVEGLSEWAKEQERDLAADQAELEQARSSIATLRDSLQQRERELEGAAGDVIAERRRQVEAEGWTPEHDDTHGTGEMAMAASCYAAVAGDPSSDSWYVEMVWPWGESWWKPSDARRNLVKAGALILAEIERLDRHSARAQQAEAKKEE